MYMRLIPGTYTGRVNGKLVTVQATQELVSFCVGRKQVVQVAQGTASLATAFNDHVVPLCLAQGARVNFPSWLVKNGHRRCMI